MKLVAIGDIHGEFDRLMTLLIALKEDHGCDADTHTYVFLGDYVDGGPDSCRVVRLLYSIQQSRPHWVFLRGNHEQMLIDASRNKDNINIFYHWFAQGGAETLESYRRLCLTDYEIAVGCAWHYIEEDVKWLDTLPYKYESESFIFVHAGLNPIAPELTSHQEMMWTRDPFLQSDRDYGKRVIVGHTYHPEPVVRPNYICIDGMRHGSGNLYAVILDDEKPDAYTFVSA